MILRLTLTRSPAPASDVDGGVLEDARARQRRHRAGALLILAALAAGALLVGMLGGGSGGGSGGRARGGPSGSRPAAGPGHPATKGFPGAPSSQANSGVDTWACPLAPPSRYLPSWSGCVTARRAILTAHEPPELLLVYSRIAHHPQPGHEVRSGPSLTYRAEQAMLRVVSPTGAMTTTAIPGARAAALVSLATVSELPDTEIFLQVAQISSGASYVAYSLYDGRPTAAGVELDAGGDSASAATFSCQAGDPPRVIQHRYALIRPIRLVHQAIFGLWREQTITMQWRGPRLRSISQLTRTRRLVPVQNVGRGCLTGVR